MTDREFIGYILLVGVVGAVAAWLGWRMLNSPRRLHRKRMREKHTWSKATPRLDDE